MHRLKNWAKPGLILFGLAGIVLLAPTEPVDPWNLLRPQKIAILIFALAFIHAAGSALAQVLGTRAGAVLTGFMGGLISSTATTASLAKKSQEKDAGEILIFLSATGAMLVQGMALVVAGSTEVHMSHVTIFAGTFLATCALIFTEFKKHPEKSKEATEVSNIEFWPVLKLALFIIAILSVSKVFQIFFGEGGLFILTALVSLFEIHGSVIANVQLHEAGVVSVRFLSTLLAVSIFSSYLSKLFLIFSLGSTRLKKQALRSTLILFIALLVCWGIALA